MRRLYGLPIFLPSRLPEYRSLPQGQAICFGEVALEGDLKAWPFSKSRFGTRTNASVLVFCWCNCACLRYSLIPRSSWLSSSRSSLSLSRLDILTDISGRHFGGGEGEMKRREPFPILLCLELYKCLNIKPSGTNACVIVLLPISFACHFCVSSPPDQGMRGMT